MIATNKFVKDNSSAVTVVGTTNVISDTEKAALNGATRVDGGVDRFATNLNVNKAFATDLKADTTYVASATGDGFADALVGAAAAGVTKSPLILIDTNGTSAATTNAIAYIKTLAPKTAVNVLGGTGVVTATTFNAISDAVNAVATGDLAVSSVSAIAANQIQVTFNQVPDDVSKIIFATAQLTNPVATTTTWNAAGTVATLTKASNFTSGTYTVNVKNDTTDLGTSTVTIADQKVAKINITSTKLGVVNATSTKPQTGYATYSILDQYGVDITNTASLSNNVTFTTGVGDITASKGLITITPSSGLNLMTFTSGITVSANDTTTGANASALLVATSQVGTLSNMTISALTNADNKVLTAGDTTDIFYIPYVATDVSGNPTTKYTLIKQGLILTGDDSDELTSSSPNVVAKVIEDPSDSSKAVIQVTATSDTISVDMPVVITAMTWAGTNSPINLTLKKQAEVAKFTLLSPNDSIASGESKNIPFSATDQNGVALTKYSDLQTVGFTNAIATRNADGTLCLKNKPVTVNSGSTSVPEVISASVPNSTTGYSSITVNIQKAVVADSLSLDSTVLKTSLQLGGANETADFGWNNGGFTVKDQYDRVIDMTTATASDYQVKVVSSDPSVIKAVTQNNVDGSAVPALTTGKTEVSITSGTKAGSATVQFQLINKNAPTVILDTKSQTFSVLANSDIKDYTIDTVPKAIYVANGMDGSNKTLSDQEKDFKANPGVYGTTSTGGKVVLAGTPVVSATSTSGDFTVFNVTGKAGDVKVVANTLDASKTGSSTTLNISVMGADGIIHPLTTPITSSTADPLAVSIDASVATQLPGISRSDDTITLTSGTATGSYKDILGNTLAKYNTDGTAGKQNVYFAPLDQYGTTSYNLSTIQELPASSNMPAGFSIASNGVITYGANPIIDGDYLTVTGITTNGLSKTIEIYFGAGTTTTTPTSTDSAAALTQINAGTETDATVFTTAGINGVVAGNLAAYKTAIATTKAAVGGDLTLPQVQLQVTNTNASEAVKAATTAVTTAETTPTSANYTAAKTLVDALLADVAPATTKADLLNRLVTVNKTITDAAVLQTSVDAANAAIAKIITAKADYVSLNGDTSATVYTVLATDKIAVTNAITGGVKATIDSTTAKLNADIVLLNAATDAL
jgi:hypothetical protein